jgi:hypothetical protein
VIAVLLSLRLTLAISLPLSFDEACYWLWSRHLALGYYEHPAAIAFAIRGGCFVREVVTQLMHSMYIGSPASMAQPSGESHEKPQNE